MRIHISSWDNMRWKEVQTHSVSVDDLSNGDVDDRFGDGHQVRVLIHIKLILQRGNITSCQEETPAMKGRIKSDGPRNKRDEVKRKE